MEVLYVEDIIEGELCIGLEEDARIYNEERNKNWVLLTKKKKKKPSHSLTTVLLELIPSFGALSWRGLNPVNPAYHLGSVNSL